MEQWRQTSSRPRRDFHFNEAWPSPAKHQKYSIIIGYNDYNLNDMACDRLEQRPDIDCLVLELNTLYKHRKFIGSVLGIKNRDWSISLQHEDSWKFLGEGDDQRLQKALVVLRDVRSLAMGTPAVYSNNAHHLHRILQNMPSFRNLKSLDLKQWTFSQLDVEDIMDLPFATQLTMVSWNTTFPQLRCPIFSPDVVQRIHSVQICMDHLPVDNALWLVNVVKELPALRHLHVELPSSFNTETYNEPITNLFRWLQSPTCTVRNLSIKFQFDQQLMVSCAYPNFRTIQRLKLIHDFSQSSANNVLHFQLYSRPRMMLIRLEMVSKKLYPPAAVEKVYHVSKIYQTYRYIHRKQMKHPTSSLPLSVWSKVLETLGKEMQVPSLTVRKVCADAMFHTLHRFFLDRWMVERPPRAPRATPANLPVVGGPTLRV